MLIILCSFSHHYYIKVSGTNFFNCDETVAEYLDMSFEKYIKLMIKWGAFKEHDEYFFYTEQDANNFVNSEDLLPYIIIKELE